MELLTNDNYFAPKSKALTNSKIKDFDVCPNYFMRKHLLGEVESEDSAALTLGSIVDKLLSGEEFDKKYHIVPRKNPSDKKAALEGGYTLLNETEYAEIFEVASAVEITDAFKYIKERAATQIILQVPRAIGTHFDSLAGKPDWQWIEGDTLFTVDLKTATPTAMGKYYYHAMGYKYDSQLAHYESLAAELNPEIKNFRSFNLVAFKQKDVYTTELYEYPREMITSAKGWLATMIERIDKERDFKKYNPSFACPVLLTRPTRTDEVEMVD